MCRDVSAGFHRLCRRNGSSLEASAMIAAYPKKADDPRKPYVMWGDTPYRHLMIPVW